MRRARLLRIGALTGLFAFLFATSALAYEGQVAGQITENGPDFLLACDNNWYLFATVREAGTGNPIEGQTVQWAITSSPDPSGDSLASSTTKTDVDGKTRNTLHISAVPGSRTVQVKADDVTDTFTVRCDKGGLPPTSTAQAIPSPSGSTSMGFGMYLAAAAVASGFGILTLKFIRR
jgi:hypothetical protein